MQRRKISVRKTNKKYPRKGRAFRRISGLLDPNSESTVALPRDLNRSTFVLELTSSVNDVNTGGTGPQAYSFLLNAVSTYRAPGGALAGMPVAPTLLARAGLFFDEFKVTEMVVRYERAFSGHDVETKDNPIDERMIVLVDNDDSSLIVSEAKALNSQLPYIVHNLLEPRQNSCVAVFPQPSGVARRTWQNTSTSFGAGASPTLVAPAVLGSVKAWVFGYPAANITRGTFYVTWRCIMRGVSSTQP